MYSSKKDLGVADTPDEDKIYGRHFAALVQYIAAMMKVLIIDDEVDLLNMTCIALTKKGLTSLGNLELMTYSPN